MSTLYSVPASLRLPQNNDAQKATLSAGSRPSATPLAQSQCPFDGARLFTRMTDSEPQRCPIGGSQIFSRVEPDYMPFKDGPWTGLSPGLTPMHPDDWIEVDEHYDDEIQEKREMFSRKPVETFNVAPEGMDCCQELLEMLASFLAERYPDRFQLHGAMLHNAVTGKTLNTEQPEIHPLMAASLLVQEDLCLLKDDGKGKMRLVAGSVAFPMGWSLLQKMGRPMHLIHAPVPFYQKDLRKPVDDFMAGLTPQQSFWRANWGVTDYPYLYQMFSEKEVVAAVQGKRKAEGLDELNAHNAGDRLYLRNERQTLKRLPKTQAVLFTIRTYTKHLRDIAGRPELCSRLTNALTVTPDEFINYKTMTSLKQAALDWLALQDQTQPAAELVLA